MRKDITLDVRKDVTKDITISVQLKNMWVVKVGMFFMKIGCWIGGFTLVDEFPMSLIQPDGEPYE